MQDDAGEAGMPLWAKVSGLLALLVLLAVAALHLTGNGLGAH